MKNASAARAKFASHFRIGTGAATRAAKFAQCGANKHVPSACLYELQGSVKLFFRFYDKESAQTW